MSHAQSRELAQARSEAPRAVQRLPQAGTRPAGWTPGRIASLVVGLLLVLISLALLGAGGTGVWADLTQRDAGYVTTGVHEFSTSRSALATEPTPIGSPGLGWLYSPELLGKVRIRVTPVAAARPLFVGIGRSSDVDRYLAGANRTVITDFFGNKARAVPGSSPRSVPGAQHFWVSSSTGRGTRTLAWNPHRGSWTVVVMNANARPGIGVRADLGARMPAALWIAIGLLLGGVVFLAGGGLVIAGAIRGRRSPNLETPSTRSTLRSLRTAPSTPSTTPTQPEGGRTMPTATPALHSGLAARMGRWSAAHWKKATFGWLAFVVVAFGLGGMVGMNQLDANTPGPGQSGRMDAILKAGFKPPAAESVLIQSSTLRAGDPGFRATIADVSARISRIGDVQHLTSGRISKDGRSALLGFSIRGDTSKAADKIQPVVDAVAAAQKAHPGFYIGEFGDASAAKAVTDVYAKDLGKAGMLSLPVTLLVLVLAFGALVAAGIPLLLALTAVVATFGLISLPSHVFPVAMQAPAMVLLIGLAVGVDYSMFYLKRERQERAVGRNASAALEAAAATSGRSVLISGLTVMTAMAGMFLTGDPTFASLGVATILVVAVAVLGSLTVLPALLSRLGDKVDRLSLPFARRRRSDGEGRIWAAIVGRVLRRPTLSAALAAAALLALAAPALNLHIQPQGPKAFPQSLPIVKAYDRMQQAFPGRAMPADVVVKARDVSTPAIRRAIAKLHPLSIDVNRSHTVARVSVPLAGTGTDSASNASLGELRGKTIPHAFGGLQNVEVGVTGATAQWKDAADAFKSNLPPVAAFVLLFAFGLMLVSFRSIVVALNTTVLNLMSVAAAYGVLALLFEQGIDPVVPLLLFVILFGLSMDYHVFILSRIRETFDRGATMDKAVAQGIKSTAGVVTSAAIVMVCVFAIFATLSMEFFKQFGVGLSAAILIDATIVRAVLLPATMTLLGNWNWYLPRWLEWVPGLERQAPSPTAASVSA